MKSGHFNAGLTVNSNASVVDANGRGKPEQSLEPVAPEYIHAAEIGMKSTWFDERLELSASLFRYWYQDLQVFDIVNEISALPTQQLLNSDANVLGAEIELQLVPIDGMSIQAGFGWLDTSYEDFIVQKRVAVGGKGGTGDFERFDYSGHSLIAAPEYTVSGIIEYEIRLSHYGALIPQFDASWKSRVFFDPQAELLVGQGDYWIGSGRLAYRTPDSRIEIAGWVHNFMDKQYKVESFDQSRESRFVQEIWAEPRTYGFTVSYLW
jgi:iron complex outermembrane receptor protein